MGKKLVLGIFIIVAVIAGFMFLGGDKAQTGNAVIAEDGFFEVTTTLQGFRYSPDTITVKEGSRVRLIIQNKDNVVHGLHLPQFGIVDSQPPGTNTFEFIATETPTNGQAVPTCSQEHGETLTFNVI